MVVPILDGDDAAWRAAGHQQQERPAVRRPGDRRRHAVVQDARHRHPPAHAEGRGRPARARATKYDGLVADGVHDRGRTAACIVQKAREEAKPVEHMLMADFQIRPAQIGPSLAKFFGVPYEPFNAGRIRSEAAARPAQARVRHRAGLDPAGGVARRPGRHVHATRRPCAARASCRRCFPRYLEVRVPRDHADRVRGDAGAALWRRRRRRSRSTSCWPT